MSICDMIDVCMYALVLVTILSICQCVSVCMYVHLFKFCPAFRVEVR